MEVDPYHVFPTDEDHLLEVEHDAKHDLICKCKCMPEIIYENGVPIVAHNSFDGREGLEMAKEILKS